MSARVPQTQAADGERLLTPSEVADLFRVDPKTVTRWAASGRITSIRTPGGHRRFRESEVSRLMQGNENQDGQALSRKPVNTLPGFRRRCYGWLMTYSAAFRTRCAGWHEGIDAFMLPSREGQKLPAGRLRAGQG